MQALPKEIQPLIFQGLFKEEVYECMKTCKAWYSEASAVYHSAVRLTYYTHENFLQVTEITRLDGTKLGDYVRKIDFFCLDDGLLDEQQFHRLIHNLPYLQRIRVDEKYIQFIENTPVSDLQHVQEVLMECYRPSLEIANSNFMANYRLKDQITNLRLMNMGVFSEPDLSLTLLTRLSQFTNLKKLAAENYGTRTSPEIHLTSILDHCQHLEALELTVDPCWYVQNNPHHVHTNLRTLVLKINTLGEQNVEYIMDHLPNLTKLDIIMNDITLEKLLLETLKPKVARRYMQYLSKIDTVILQRYWLQCVSNLGIGSLEQSQSFWSLIREMCGDSLHCKLGVNTVSTTDESDGAYLWKENKGVDIICKATWTYLDLGELLNQLDFLTFKMISLYDVPDMLPDENGDLIQHTDMYSYAIRPALDMLKRQGDKEVCSLYLQCEPQELSFEYPEGQGAKMKSLKLHSDMLSSLAQIYASTRSLTLEKCGFEKEEDSANSYYVDLSVFKDMDELIFDFDAIYEKEPKLEARKLYIQLSSVDAPSEIEYYMYTNESQNDLLYIENTSELAISEADLLLKISHAHIKKFTFKRDELQELSITRPNK